MSDPIKINRSAQRVVFENEDMVVIDDDTATLRLIAKGSELSLSFDELDEIVDNVRLRRPRSPRCTSPAKARIQRFKIESTDAQQA